VVIVTNIDSDHMDYYKTFDRLKIAFLEFALRIPFYGLAIVCGDDPIVKEVFTGFPKRVVSYGFGQDNDFILRRGSAGYRVRQGGQDLGEITPPLPGVHNALNALATVIVGLEAGLTFQQCNHGLQQFKGVDRRFQLKGEWNEVLVYDDYGHHPTEVRAVLSAFREKFSDRRLVVAFQPHRYSRTQHCWQDFLSCFSEADKLYILDIYPAGEEAVPGVSSETLAAEIEGAVYVGPVHGAASVIKNELQPGDVFVTLGAGNGWRIGEEILGFK
jgi:UDP-N-acetylmuramate--alanine ligase